MSSHSYQLKFESPVDFVPQRVVSLAPNLTETLFDLDLGDRLIAAATYCAWPAIGVESHPLSGAGGIENPDINDIVSLGPDLVLLDDEETRQKDVEALQAAGLAVWIAGPRTVFDVLNLLWNIMSVFDHGVMSPRVREIERAYDYTLGAARALEPVRVFAPLECEPWITFNAHTYAHDVVRVCGGMNVFAGSDQFYPTITPEAVIEVQPEVVLLPEGFETNTIRALDIPAAHSGRIHPIDSRLLTWRGTRVGYALRDLPPLLFGRNR